MDPFNDPQFVLDEFILAFDYENWLYTPPGGQPRTVSILVERKEPKPIPGTQRANAPEITVSAVNADSHGIGTASVKLGLAKLKGPPRVGADAEEFTLGAIVSEDPGLVVYRLR